MNEVICPVAQVCEDRCRHGEPHERNTLAGDCTDRPMHGCPECVECVKPITKINENGAITSWSAA